MEANKFKLGRAVIWLLTIAVFALAFYVWQQGRKGNPIELTPEQEVEGMEAQVATDEIKALFDTLGIATAQGIPVIICKYEIQAAEELPRPFKVGNFETQYINDRYGQDKPFVTILPGKDISGIDLLKVVPPQEQGAIVKAIRSVTRIPGTCKPYRFEPEPPQEDIDPK